MAVTHYLACDLGAESGRLMLGSLEDGRLSMAELHRFPNGPVTVGGSLHWNIEELFAQLKQGLKKAAASGRPITSISTDSWGLDYVFLDEKGELIPPTFHYRDPRNDEAMRRVRSQCGDATIFGETGIQFMSINTLYQLAAETPERLAQARRIVLIADAFNYWLSGVAKSEVSLASTTQFYNPVNRAWSETLLRSVGVSPEQLPPIVPSGTMLGPMTASVARETGLSGVQVVAGCSHDTGAAVAAVPAEGGGSWAYLSSGTWSLLGVELEKPVINETSRALNFTNEIGYGDSVRLLKNIIGLWLVQECRRHWAEDGKTYDYATLTRMAAEARPFEALINPSDARFLPPGDMPGRIAEYCRETGQAVPTGEGGMVRCILESLALLYRFTLRQIESLTDRRVERLHIVGGGSRNALLNQFAADALQVPVLAGPVEATAAGNILVQALAVGHLKSLAEARQVVRRSFALENVVPGAASPWDEAYERFQSLVHPRSATG